MDRQLRRDFPGDACADATALIDRIGTELATWDMVRASDRVERAALKYAGGNLRELSQAVELALLDWRDLLVSVGDA